MKLVTFPHAGGFGSYYRPLKELEQSGINVVNYEYPGHGSRFREALFEDADSAIATVFSDLFSEGSNEDIIFFGHSMGGYVAYEVAYEMRIKGIENRLKGIIVSGAVPPVLDVSSGIDLENDEEIIRYLASLGGVNSTVFDCAEFMNMHLKIVRADLKLIDNYKFRIPEKPFEFPVKLLYAHDDKIMASAEKMELWGSITNSYLGSAVFDGGHFYLNQKWDKITAEITDVIQKSRVNKNERQ